MKAFEDMERKGIEKREDEGMTVVDNINKEGDGRKRVIEGREDEEMRAGDRA